MLTRHSSAQRGKAAVLRSHISSMLHSPKYGVSVTMYHGLKIPLAIVDKSGDRAEGRSECPCMKGAEISLSRNRKQVQSGRGSRVFSLTQMAQGLRLVLNTQPSLVPLLAQSLATSSMELWRKITDGGCQAPHLPMLMYTSCTRLHFTAR
ncbi:hypothetical protein J1614_003007 [Plenodomus biglobosus]|nr:hypothetical protein J1614_003007 [Plenodomus biglobosus]